MKNLKYLFTASLLALPGCGWVPGWHGHCYPEKTMQASFVNSTGHNVAVVACAENPLIPAKAELIAGDGNYQGFTELVERAKINDQGSQMNCDTHHRNTTVNYEKIQIEGTFTGDYRLCERDSEVNLPAGSADNAIVGIADPCPAGYKNRPAQSCGP